MVWYFATPFFIPIFVSNKYIMNKDTLSRFKSLLSVPSKSKEEGHMVSYICDYLDELSISGGNVDYYTDGMGNIYITKGSSDLYPCFIAHTDTVHEIAPINVVESVGSKPDTFGKSFGDDVFDILYGVDNDGKPTGIGGDDKCGIFICLELINRLDECKVALFVSEEIGCIGSRNADLEFFDDVSFVCEYDAPGDHLISEISSGVRLYESNGDFITLMKQSIEEAFGNPMIEQSHPYTDVMVLKDKLPVSCINISCGYYNMHTPKEFISVDDVDRAIQSGINIAQHGYEYKFYYENQKIEYVNDIYDDIYESEKAKWISDEVVVFDDGESGITLEEYESGSTVSLTSSEMKKLYHFLIEKYEGSQMRLF